MNGAFYVRTSKTLLEKLRVFEDHQAWTQFMSGQGPLMQGLMGNYLEQSKNLFVQMQEQMQKNAGALFPGFPGAKR